MRKKDPSRELAIAAADLAADGKALDISILELREISSVADYFVVASGRSHIQVESICDRVVEGVRDRLAEKPIAAEGLENSQWAVLDYGSVVVHVFQEGVRKVYDLERLWSLAPSWKHGEEPPPPRPAPQADTPARKSAAGADRKAAGGAGKKPAAKKPVAKKPARTASKASAAKAGAKPAAKVSALPSDKKPAAKKASGTRSRAAAG